MEFCSLVHRRWLLKMSIPAYIKDRFACSQSPSSVILSPFEKLEVSSGESISPLISEDSNAVDSVEPNKLLALDQIVRLLSFPNELLGPGIHLPNILESESENRISVPPVGLGGLPSPLSQSIGVDQLEIGESELFRLYFLKEEVQAYPECNAYRAEACGEISDEVTNPYPAGFILEPSFGDYDIDDACFLNFPEECELHKALEPSFERHVNDCLLDSSFLSKDAFRDGIDVKGGDGGYLLQAVVGHVYGGSVDIANRSTCIMTSTGQHQVSSRPQSVKTDSASSSRLMSAVVGGVKSNPSSKISSSFKSTVSTITDDGNLGNDGYYTQSGKGKKQSTVSKKRARPGDNPRPRDRQMIQDRLKELRELVPNGPKH